MVMVKDVPAGKLIGKAAEELAKMAEFPKPEWAKFVKTGPSRERAPQEQNWWWLRGASILRKVYLEQRGVSKLRKEYSGRKNRGHKPEHTRRGSGKIIRVLLKQLEGAGFVKIEKGKGRMITPAGQKFLDGIAKRVGEHG